MQMGRCIQKIFALIECFEGLRDGVANNILLFFACYLQKAQRHADSFVFGNLARVARSRYPAKKGCHRLHQFPGQRFWLTCRTKCCILSYVTVLTQSRQQTTITNHRNPPLWRVWYSLDLQESIGHATISPICVIITAMITWLPGLSRTLSDRM